MSWFLDKNEKIKINSYYYETTKSQHLYDNIVSMILLYTCWLFGTANNQYKKTRGTSRTHTMI